MSAYAITKSPYSIIELPSGKQVFFDVNRFIEHTVKGGHCFICDAAPWEKPFNDEHVISNWILKRFNLHSERITLPNGSTFRYGGYTIPCCQECNTLLGSVMESPVRGLLALPYNQLTERLEYDEDGWRLLWKFMALVFFKTHLKDMQLLLDLDPRKNSGKIGDLYDWASLHHVHCIVRSPWTNALIDDQVYGSLFVLPAWLGDMAEEFDYMDNNEGQTVLIRLGETVLIAVLNDSRAAMGFLSNYVEKIKAPLSIPQVKQFFAHAAHINQHLKTRPVYYSTVTDRYSIKATLPEKPELLPVAEQKVTFGELLAVYIERLIPDTEADKSVRLELIRSGSYQFLFNEKMEFIDTTKITRN